MIKRANLFCPNIDSAEIYRQAVNHPQFVKMQYITNVTDFLISDLNIGKILFFSESSDEINALKQALNILDGIYIYLQVFL